MTINTCNQAILKAAKQTRNKVGTCQMTVRTWFNAPSAGDVDGDGDADAKDGWLSEPAKYRVMGDRNPPDGVPLYFAKNGGTGFGHRALSVPRGVRSTDMNDHSYAPGITSTVIGTHAEAIAIIERAMNVVYIGWSKTIDGSQIPDFFKPKPPTIKKTSRGAKVDKAIVDATALVKDVKAAARDAKETVRNKHLNRAAVHAQHALDNLKKVPFIK